MPVAPGTILGRYRVSTLVGRGGMGEVYRALDTQLERTVALKVLPTDIAADSDRMQRFVQEAKATSSLNHPNIITIHEIGTSDGVSFIATEFVEGETLRERLAPGCMTITEVCDVAIQLASALAAAHPLGVVHRDIKPENVMIRPDGIVKVLDFGLAKLVAKPVPQVDTEAATLTRIDTDPGIVFGTVAYMSPEQLRGLTVDARTDLWSLGVVLYEMATSQRPFEQATRSDVIAAILDREPAPISLVAPETPEALEWIITKALTKDRDGRYQSATELLADLKRLRPRLDGAEHETLRRRAAKASIVSAQPASSAELIVSGIKRHKAAVALAAMFIVGAAALAFTYWPRTSPGFPKVTGSTQVTRDNRRKNALVTDGTRIYYSPFEGEIYQVSAAGGEAIPLITGLPSTLVDISSDGAELLLLRGRFSGGSHSSGQLLAQPVVGGTARHIGNQPTSGAAWSPDRRQIALGCGPDILIITPDGSDSRKVASVDGIVEELSWSPDASRLRFTVFSLKDSSSALWEVAVDGSGLRALLPNWNRPPDECCGRWSPDGRHYVFQSRRNGAKNIWALTESGSRSQRAEAEPTQLTFGPIEFSSPALSRDGKKLFAVGEFRRGEIVRYDAHSRQLQPFMPGLSAEGLDFSKDGQWVVYVSYPEPTLWRSRVDGTERMQLTTSPMRVGLPRWSPDAQRIAFAASSPGPQARTWKSYVISASGGTPQPIAPDDQNDSTPSWSPDGMQVAFGYTFEASRSSHGGGIQIVDLKTNKVSRLPGSERMFSPRWSPDGRSILAQSIDLTQFMVFDLTTRKWTELARADAFWPSWSPDGQYVVFYTDLYSFRAGAVSVMRVRVSDHKIERVASIEGIQAAFGVFGRWVGQATDGSPLFLRDTGGQEIYALEVQFP